jgi:uncharacterized membrane protein (DUF485 family)
LDPLPLHPKIVHLPMALSVLVPFFSLALLLAWVKGWLPKRGWLVAVAMQLILVVTGYVALESGEEEEDRVEEVVGHDVIHEHEEAAELFFQASIAGLLLFAAAALVRKEPIARGLAGAAVLGSFAVLYLGVQTGERGGSLVYRHNAGAAYVTPGHDGGGGSAGADSASTPATGERDDHGSRDD